MKIGIDARLWNETGVGRYIRNLVEQLQKIDKTNTYILFVRRADISSIKHYISSEKWKLVNTDIRWHTLQEQLHMPKLLEKEDLNLVHFPYFSVPILYKGKFVVTIHDLILHHFATGQASTLPLPLYNLKLYGYKYIISKAAKKAQRVITVSQATKDEIIKHLKIPKEKVVVTYEGVDKKISNGKSSSNLSEDKQILNIKEPYFLYVGNAYPHKNLTHLLLAFRKLIKERASKVKLILVGREDYFYKRLKQKVKNLELSDSVVFKDYVTDEKLGYLYSHALAVVLPSLMEGFGLPGLEAMSRKCLVLASDIPVHREIYSQAALYFNPQNIEEIKNMLLSVLNTPKSEFNKNIDLGAARTIQFDWEKMANQTLAVYQEAAS